MLESDVDAVKAKMKNVFETVAKKDCKFATESQDLLVKRVTERTDYIKKALGKDFKFNKETEFVYDPDKKTFPKTDKEAT